VNKHQKTRQPIAQTMHNRLSLNLRAYSLRPYSKGKAKDSLIYTKKRLIINASTPVKFYGLRGALDEDAEARIDRLTTACEKRSLDYIDIDVTTADYLNYPRLDPGDILFQIGRAPSFLSRLMVNKQVATVYRNLEIALTRRPQIVIHEKYGIPIPKTIHYITPDRDLLKKYVAALGGYPVIVKAMAGSKGLGVMKIDSYSSLVSVLDHVLKGTRLVMRKYIETKTSERLLVLGDKVIDSYRYHRQQGDIRANVGKTPNVEAKQYSQKIQETAIAAVNLLGYEFGGVDILIDDNKHYVIEANVPYFNFVRASDLTGKDIAGMLVDHLIAKSKKITGDKPAATE